MGIHIAIDDFGTEYSSLSYLKHLPVDRIKLAMPFVQGLEVSDKDQAITKAVIILAKSMGMGIIAEGVETEYQLDFLNQRMCDEVQGFYYYKPMPVDEMEELLKQGAVARRKGEYQPILTTMNNWIPKDAETEYL
jgi:EAL domain-containing protein (putative c-di-GMP-specific phosphodiesterase class I)